jgi:hypothetical protein
MANEIIERAARAAWEDQRAHLNDLDLKPWEEELPGLRDDWRRFMRVGLEAMREPPCDMRGLFPDAIPSDFETFARLTWERMIDAALS